jgi:dTDP-glucose 4,6-dehydratase
MRKKVLITGGPGFIAHHIIDLLMKVTDWDIVSLDRLDFSGNLNRLHEIAAKYPAIEQIGRAHV